MYKPKNGWTKDSMIQHIMKEFKGKSLHDSKGYFCQYRGCDGKKCAVGMFIPNEKYVPQMDDQYGPVSEVLEHHPDLRNILPLHTFGLMKFQSAHDTLDANLTVEDQLATLVRWINNHVED